MGNVNVIKRGNVYQYKFEIAKENLSVNQDLKQNQKQLN